MKEREKTMKTLMTEIEKSSRRATEDRFRAYIDRMAAKKQGTVRKGEPRA